MNDIEAERLKRLMREIERFGRAVDQVVLDARMAYGRLGEADPSDSKDIPKSGTLSPEIMKSSDELEGFHKSWATHANTDGRPGPTKPAVEMFMDIDGIKREAAAEERAFIIGQVIEALPAPHEVSAEWFETFVERLPVR